jgi:hypothetical protein
MAPAGLVGDRLRGPSDQSRRNDNLTQWPEFRSFGGYPVPGVFRFPDKLVLPLAFNFCHSDSFLALAFRAFITGVMAHFAGLLISTSAERFGILLSSRINRPVKMAFVKVSLSCSDSALMLMVVPVLVFLVLIFISFCSSPSKPGRILYTSVGRWRDC